MTMSDVLTQIRAGLRARADAEFRRGVENFFREPVDAYGVRAPEVKAVAREAWGEVKEWPEAALAKLAAELWKSGKIEEAGIAILIYRRRVKRCGAREFRLFERWIDRYVGNWASCDGVASWLLAASIGNEPALIGELDAWVGSRNRWKRRAAAVALLQEAKQARHAAAIFRITGALLEDPDDMVQKGVGWVLKETYPKKPAEVMAFLLPRAARTPRLVLRLAAEKMTAADRGRLLRRD
ncbi:MAG TPA: DNA alkylation repair protein [Bryobacteraceae bacterium]|nr:DNA alkylation repair protein [Bryobacteraceae bacterium]